MEYFLHMLSFMCICIKASCALIIRHNSDTLFVALYSACNHSLQMDLFNPKTVLGSSLAKPPGQMSLSENLKKFQKPHIFLSEFLPPLLEFHLVRNQLPASRNLSQYLGGELFLNLHLNFPISRFISNSLAGPIGLQSSPPLKFPSNTIKASTLVTIKPWSEPQRAG